MAKKTKKTKKVKKTADDRVVKNIFKTYTDWLTSACHQQEKIETVYRHLDPKVQKVVDELYLNLDVALDGRY